MSQYSQYIREYVDQTTAAPEVVVGTIEDDPEKAARAMELGAASNVPPSVVYGDLENFERIQRSQLASDLVANNPQLSEYVLREPMASKVSNDDYGQLDAVSQAALKFVDGAGLWQAAWKGTKEGFGEEPWGSWVFRGQGSEEFVKNNRLVASVLSVGGLPIELGFRALGGATYAAAEIAGRTAEIAAGGGPDAKAHGDRMRRDVLVAANVAIPEFVRGGNVMTVREWNRALRDTVKHAETYLEAGQEPPVGIHPLFDEVKKEEAKAAVKQLDEALKEAQKSATRDRNPEIFASFMRQHSDATIAVSGEAVAKLYGEKLPLADDNLLGWVPGIAEQLEVARRSGVDVEIPLADWLAKVEPEVAKELHDFTRVRPGTVTLDEAKLLEPKEVIAEPLAQVRGSAGLEPLFAVGDRKLTLQRSQEKLSDAATRARKMFGMEQFHKLDILDETGKNVGYIQLNQKGADLYVEYIRGIEGAHTFGPALTRDILRQIKEEFPDAKTLSGHRVTGARDKLGTWEDKGTVSIKLAEGWDLVDTSNEFTQILEGGAWREIATGTEAYFKPRENYGPHEKALMEAVDAEIERLAPGLKQVEASAIRSNQATRPQATYLTKEGLEPLIVWAMDNQDVPMAVGLARHEVVHHLKRAGFFSPDEWAILEHHAKMEDWGGQFEIGERYAHRDAATQVEEAIAEKFRYFRRTGDAPAAVKPLFERLLALLEAVRHKVQELFGKNVSWQDIFERVESGEVGRREPRTPSQKEGFAASEGPAQPELPGTTRLEDRSPFTRFNWRDVMTVDMYDRYQKAIEAKYKEDMEWHTGRAEKEQKKRQTAEWKENERRVRAEVADEFALRPDVSTDRFFGEGIVYGEKLETKPKLAEEYLTPDQIAALPKDYVRKTGIHPDDVANLFGYPSGQAMIEHLVSYTLARQQSGMRSLDYSRRLIDIETERRMQAQYGDLPANILEAAKEQALSETQVQLLHEEMLALGLKHNAEFSISKADVAAWVEGEFSNTPARLVRSDKFLEASGRSGRAAEAALLKGDYAEAFRAKQQQYLGVSMAREAAKFEKEQKRFERITDRLSRRKVENIDQEYVDFAQQLMIQAGLPVRRGLDEVAAGIERTGFTSLPEFVTSKLGEGWELAVGDNILAGTFKQLNAMSVDEWREFRDAITSLAHVGREVRKIIVAGEKAEWEAYRQQIVDNITSLPLQPKQRGAIRRFLFRFDAELTRMEELAKDFDLREAMGPMFNVLIRPMAEAKHTEYALQEALSKRLAEIKGDFGRKWMRSLNDTIPNDWFMDPYDNVAFDLNRGHMIQIMLNFGNRSNIEKFTKGYFGKENAAQGEQMLRQMFDQHATKQDWEYVQAIWNIFEDWRKMSDEMYYQLSGVSPKWIKPEAVDTPHGQFPGGYFPVIYDRTRSNIATMEGKASTDALFAGAYFRATPPAHYTKTRTGFAEPIQFYVPLEMVGSRMQQMMHDIAYRRAVIDAGKVVYDRGIRAAIRKHYGPEYDGQMVPWLKDIANHFNTNEQAIGFANSVLRRARYNLIAHSLGLNLKVLGSPDVGAFNPFVIANVMRDKDANVALAYEKSKEIPHTFRNMDRDFRERLENTIETRGWKGVEADSVRWSFLPLVKVSQGFRIATFVDAYQKALREGMDDGAAAAHADSLVRERHGAGGLPDLPAIMRSSEAMKISTTFYGFFSAMYNWQRQLPGNIRRREWMNAMENLYGAVLIPALFGAALFNKADKEDGWFKILGKALLLQPLSTLVFGREVASYFIEGYPSRSPLASIMVAVGQAGRDITKAMEGKRVEKPIQHTANVIGLTRGLPLAQIGRTGQFGYDVATGRQRPKNIQEWVRGIIHGEAVPKR